ncbi:MAG: NDP-sugar synthase [Acidimicrobiia bacterium]|nr:NDP-sugar synthase [Acidimicrobiia bacterium]
MIPALVLTAGLATRLRPLSLVRAKAALPVAGQPLAHRILRWLAAAGVTDAVLNLHHLPHTLTALIGDGSALGVRVRYSWELPVLGSAGGPRRALPLLGAPTFLVVNGDTLTNVDLQGLVGAHEGSGALATIAVVPHPEPGKYGGVLVDDHGAVRGFAARGSPEASYHFVGVQVADAGAFAAVPDGVPTESFAKVYPELMAARPGSIRAYVTAADFADIGTPADYLRTSLALAAREGGTRQLIGARARLDASARVEASVLWDDVEMGAGARVRECVVTDGAQVPADTSWTGVTLRRADDELAPNERRIGNLAVAALDG